MGNVSKGLSNRESLILPVNISPGVEWTDGHTYIVSNPDLGEDALGKPAIIDTCHKCVIWRLVNLIK